MLDNGMSVNEVSLRPYNWTVANEQKTIADIVAAQVRFDKFEKNLLREKVLRSKWAAIYAVDDVFDANEEIGKKMRAESAKRKEARKTY